MENISMFDRTDRCLVGHPAIDEAHREFDRLAQAMLNARSASQAASLMAFLDHVQAHFDLEEELMESHEFPARACHAEEHERVLASVREAGELLACGDFSIVGELAQALLDWFPGHSDYMDASLAAWVTRRTIGGVPMVLRRKAQHPTGKVRPSLQPRCAEEPAAAETL